MDVAADGRVIDWTLVAARARAHGLPFARREELIAAIFADGVSTAHEVTEVSGRGVGLAAVRACVLDAGGRLAVDSDGRGTRFRFELPLSNASTVRLAG